MSNLWSQSETILSSKTLKFFFAYDIRTLIIMKQSEVRSGYLDFKTVIAEFKTVKKPGHCNIHFVENQISGLEDGLGEVVQELEERGKGTIMK